MSTAEKNLATIYQQHGAEPETAHRPQKEEFLSYASIDRRQDAYTDTVIDEICTR